MIGDTIIKAVSWTLIHSLWQGVILAVCAGLIILATKKSAANLRYNLLSGLFVAFLSVVGLTFNYEFIPEGQETITRFNLPIVQQQINQSFSGTVTVDLSNTIIGFLNRNANLIALIWFAIFAMKLIGIFNSFNHIYRIRNYKNFAVSDYWKLRVCELAHQIHIRKPIVLLESALVKIPSVTGFLKPIILVPIGMLSNLPQDQAEAILLHELAHIRRKDYVINVLQHLAEMIFFFNPGLLWLSSLLKDERENCCDDIALGVIGNKVGFVHALVSFTEYNLNNQLAVGFAGKKNHLLSRAKRIIHNDNKSLNAVEKTFLLASLLLVMLVMIACANPSHVDEISRAMLESQITEEHAQVMDENAKIVDRAAAEIEAEADRENQQAKETYNEAQRSEKLARLDELAAIAEAKRYEAADRQLNALVCTPQPAAHSEPMGKSEPVANPNQKHSVTTRTVTSKTETEQNYEREVTTYDFANPQKNQRVSLRTGVSGEDLPDNMNVGNLTSNIISDLMSENVIRNTNNLSYKLSGTSLIVNGVTLPERVHARLKSKYMKEKMHAICYNYDFSVSAVTSK